MIVKKFLAVLVCMCSLAGSASAGLMLPGNDPAHIALGSQFGAVGWVEGTNSSNQTAFRQSNTLINPNWSVASLHGVLENDADRNSLYSNIRVGFGGNYINNQGENRLVSNVFLHPTKDIALFKFDIAFTSVTPMDRHTGFVTNGTEGYTVGFGRLQYVNDPVSTFTGDRRAGFDVVDGINLFEPDNFKTRFDFAGQGNFRPLEMGGRNGDSGGPWVLANLGLPTNFLAGIIDSGNLMNGFGTNSFYTRVGDEINWINSVTSVPEPTSITLTAIGFVYLVRRRSRTK